MKVYPIKSAPYNKIVLLLGKSNGDFPNDIFVINGYRSKDEYDGEWQDVNGVSISGFYNWEPVAWASPSQLVEDFRVNNKT